MANRTDARPEGTGLEDLAASIRSGTACRICQSDSIKATYTVREMMYGTRETFQYFECGACGCLQIAEFPEDTSKYYPADYYSVKPHTTLKRYLLKRRLAYIATGHGVLGRAVSWVVPPERNPNLAPRGRSKSDRILEVGCGNGVYLRKLFELGFRRVYGIDPYMDPHYTQSDPYPLGRKDILELELSEGPFDIVLFDHTFEHIREQHETLAKTRALLSPEGACILRIPFVSSYAWEFYKTDWVQLDAPRHLFLHSYESLKALAEATGFRIEDIIHDSTFFQFWGSEQYKKDIPIYAPNSWRVNPRKSPFDDAQIEAFKVRADEHNREGRGDQVTVYLRKS